MRHGCRWLVIIIVFVLSPLRTLAAPVRGSLVDQGDTVHFEAEGRPSWIYDVHRRTKDGKTFVDVTLDSIDESSRKALVQFKSPFVKSVRFDQTAPQGKSTVVFELKGEEVETFDYLTDQPSRLILDFYVTPESLKKKNASKAAKKEKHEAAAEKAETKVEEKGAVDVSSFKEGKADRKPANDTLILAQNGANSVAFANGPESREIRAGLFDGGDPGFERFSMKDYEIREEAILKSKQNYYIPFPMRVTENPFWEKVRIAEPLYSISAKQSDENKMARLLLTLYEKKRFNVYLKTLEWWNEKYPESEYNDLISYMTGDVYMKRWEDGGRFEDYELAMQAYRTAVVKHPKSPVAERTSLLTGYIALTRGDALGAMKFFNSHVENANFGDSKVYSKDLARLGLGLSLMKLFRTDEAFKTFEDLEKNSQFKELRTDAAYRRGDTFAASKNFPKAVEEYRRALSKYPEAQLNYPGAFFNQAESLFETEHFRPSLEVYRDFVKKFPSDEYAPFAMTRLGELLEILGADQRRVMGAYLETYFRYGENPKAIVARIRMLSARMKGMKPREVETATQEILSLAKKLDLPNIEQFATVLISDGYSLRGEYEKSIGLLDKYYRANPTAPELDRIKNRIVANINDEFRNEVQDGQFIQALKTHQKYKDSWLKGSDRMDTKFYLGRAFEFGGAFKESERLYREVLNDVLAVRGTPREKSLLVSQHLPSESSISLRLAQVADQRRDSKSAYDYLKQIKNPETLTDEEQIERVQLAVRLLENRGDLDSATRYLTELLRTWKGQPELVMPPYLKLAEIEIKQNKKDDALVSLKKIDQLSKDSGEPGSDVHARALELLGGLQLEKGQKAAAIETFGALLGKYEEKKPLSSIRYKLGQIYFEQGEIQKAAETWAGFKGKQSEFWKNLAQEQLKNSEWRDDYKKYLKRIPAMAQ